MSCRRVSPRLALVPQQQPWEGPRLDARIGVEMFANGIIRVDIYVERIESVHRSVDIRLVRAHSRDDTRAYGRSWMTVPVILHVLSSWVHEAYAFQLYLLSIRDIVIPA